MLKNSFNIWLHKLKNKIQKWISYKVRFTKWFYIYQLSIHTKSFIKVYLTNVLLHIREILKVSCQKLIINDGTFFY